MKNILEKLIAGSIFLLAILLPTSFLSLIFNIHPALFLIFLLLVFSFLRNYGFFADMRKIPARSRKFYESNKKIIFLFAIFLLLFLQSFFSLIFAPEMPQSAYEWKVSGFESPDYIRWYGLFTLLKSMILGILLAVLIKGREFFLKIIKLHIIASVLFSLFGIINFLVCCVFKVSSFDFGVIAERIRSVSVEPQAFASYLLTVIPFLLLGLFFKKEILFKKRILIIFLFIDFLAFVLTFSTGGYIAFLAIFFLFYLFLLFKDIRKYFNGGNIKIVSVFLLAGIIIFCAFGQNYLSCMFGKFFKGDSFFLGGRVVSYRAGFEMIKDRPFFGVGPESYGYYFKEYSDASPPKSTIEGPGAPAAILPVPQNLLIGIGANIGILGGILYFLIFFYLWKKLFYEMVIWNRDKSLAFEKSDQKSFQLVFSFSFLLVLTGLFIQNMAFWAPYAFFLWFFIGICGAFVNSYT